MVKEGLSRVDQQVFCIDIIQSCKILDFYRLCYILKKKTGKRRTQRVLTNYSHLKLNQIDKSISICEKTK